MERVSSSASITFIPPGWQMNRSTPSIERDCSSSIASIAGRRFARAKFGIERAKMTPRPVGSTRQPIMSTVSGQVCSAEDMIDAIPPSPVRSTHAAAPSPNSAVATMSALLRSSSRNARLHNSTATNSTRAPGLAAASLAARASPETPPAHPSPKTGTRTASDRKSIRPIARASRLGVAIPVEETVTMISTSDPARPASSSAPVAASMNNSTAPSI